jgi:rRNA-processing protein FCF1
MVPKSPSCRAFLPQHQMSVTYCVIDEIEAFSLNFAHELKVEIALGILSLLDRASS